MTLAEAKATRCDWMSEEGRCHRDAAYRGRGRQLCVAHTAELRRVGTLGESLRKINRK